VLLLVLLVVLLLELLLVLLLGIGALQRQLLLG
jgi:hypothetical protein